MKRSFWQEYGLSAPASSLIFRGAGARRAGKSQRPSAALAAAPPVYPVPVLDWVPPALRDLNTDASMKESFTFDRTMLKPPQPSCTIPTPPPARPSTGSTA